MIYDTFNPVIFDFIKQDKRKEILILDVGCGTGLLGKNIKKERRCFVCGIELDEEAADIARQYYDEVHMMDLEDIIKGIKPINLQRKFDYIIYGDILEHVSNAEALLSKFNECLADRGFVIASIPNVANWMIRLKLFFGNFTYSGGILDRGHLRFFTFKTACRLLKDGGLNIVNIENNNTTALCKVLGRIWAKMFAFQFVFLCDRSK